MTTQVARIDAHLLNRETVTRLCYAGSVLHTQPSGLHATREPLQIGAEIYGHAGLEADAEIQELALASLALNRPVSEEVAMTEVPGTDRDAAREHVLHETPLVPEDVEDEIQNLFDALAD